MSYTTSIPLILAVLCEDCKHITISYHHECARCGSKAIVNLQALLEKELVK